MKIRLKLADAYNIALLVVVSPYPTFNLSSMDMDGITLVYPPTLACKGNGVLEYFVKIL